MHTSQEDELLRRARLDDHARTVVLDIAGTLTDLKPWREMTEGLRLARPLSVAERIWGRGTHADEIARAARALMPSVDQPITRGEYALILRRAAGQDR